MANQIYNCDGNSHFLCLLKRVDVKGGRWSLISNVTVQQYHKELIPESNRNLPDGNSYKYVNVSSHFKFHFSKNHKDLTLSMKNCSQNPSYCLVFPFQLNTLQVESPWFSFTSQLLTLLDLG